MQSLSLLSPPAETPPAVKPRRADSLTFVFAYPQPSNRWRSFLLSIFFHVLCVLVLPPLTAQLSHESDRELLIRQERRLRTLRIRIPEQLYVASSGEANPPKQRLAVKLRSAGQAKGAAAEAERAARAGRPRRRRFELPALPRRDELAQIILQPQFAPDALTAARVRLPEVFFWAPRTSPPQNVAPFVTPGHAAPPTQARVLDAPPKLEVPTAEPTAVNAVDLPTLAAALRLPVPPGLPIRTSEAEDQSPRTGVSADPVPGDPTAVLSLALDAERMREFLTVPPGNQVGLLPEGGAVGSGALSGAGGNGGDGTGARTAGQSGAGRNGTGGQTAAGQPAPQEESAAAEQTASTMRSMALAAAEPTRIVHPSSGVFDVVVESGGAAGFPESAGVLSGKPVYSAYVEAGGSKDWLLQYCVPAGEDQEVDVSGPVVRLGSGSPPTAPYPLVTLRPPVKPRPGRYVMVHGFVTPEGRFQDLRALGNLETWEAEMVLAVLDQWHFRPSHREGKAIRIEVLLAIPAE